MTTEQLLYPFAHAHGVIKMELIYIQFRMKGQGSHEVGLEN